MLTNESLKDICKDHVPRSLEDTIKDIKIHREDNKRDEHSEQDKRHTRTRSEVMKIN